MRCANSRASMSVVAPAGNGTMTRMVLVGDQACAMAGLPISVDAPSAAAPVMTRRRVTRPGVVFSVCMVVLPLRAVLRGPIVTMASSVRDARPLLQFRRVWPHQDQICHVRGTARIGTIFACLASCGRMFFCRSAMVVRSWRQSERHRRSAMPGRIHRHPSRSTVVRAHMSAGRQPHLPPRSFVTGL